MKNPHEVDVSKEDIAGSGTGLSEEGKEFFGVKEEESMPATRRSKREAEPEREEEVVEDTITVVVHTPRHLWGLGATQFHFHNVENTDDAFDIVAKMQENFEWAEEEFADRLATVAALENRITPAQIAKLEELAEERDEELPDLTHYSKTEASKLIQELIGQSQRTREPAKRSSSPRRSTRTSTRTKSRTRSNSGGGRSSRSSGNKRRGGFDNDRPGSITDGQIRFLRNLYRQADEQAPDDLEDMTFKKASSEITDLKDALGLD